MNVSHRRPHQLIAPFRFIGRMFGGGRLGGDPLLDARSIKLCSDRYRRFRCNRRRTNIRSLAIAIRVYKPRGYSLISA